MESQNCSRDSRELWLDLAKAIGIIMVLIAHALPKDSYLWSWINSFHMPLFFSISGYLYVCKKTFLSYLIRKIKTLYIPFLVASLIMYLVFIIINKTQFTIKEILKIVLTITSGPLLGATWFIPVLLFTSVLYDLIYRGIRNLKINKDYYFDFILSLFAIVLFIIGVKISLPYKGAVICRSFLYFQLGYIVKKYSKKGTNLFTLIIGLSMMVVVCIVAKYTTSSYLNNSYTSLPLFLVSSVFGTIGTLFICKYIGNIINLKNHRIVLYIGQNTMGVLIYQFVAFKIVSCIQIFYYHLSWSKISDFPVIYDYAFVFWVTLDVIIGIFASTILYLIINRPFDIFADKVGTKVKEVIG